MPKQTLHVKALKARRLLQLPCFKTLGISSRSPAALLTPPDESVIDLNAPQPPGLIPRSSSQPPPNMPKTPSPERSDFPAMLGSDPSNTQASGTSQPDMVPIELKGDSMASLGTDLSSTHISNSDQPEMASIKPMDDSAATVNTGHSSNEASSSSQLPTALIGPKGTSAGIVGIDLSNTEASSSTQVPTAATENQDTAEEHGTGPTSSSSEDDDLDPAHARWIVDAVDTAGMPKFPAISTLNTQHLKLMFIVASIDTSPGNVVVLCHSQPCPLPKNATEAEATTAFHSLMSGVQNRIDSNDRYIHITHAVPVRFSMGQIPNSPATTPSIHNPSAASADYFSLPTNVFSNAVVAMGHQDALNSSTPSSPHPVVPPASVSISLLERFVPPPSSEEYLNLFSTEGPSVLVDRLIELSPNGGSLIFIYPTATGADTFATTYLGPLLHPLLRTLCSIHNLSMDFGAGVGSIGAVDQMLSFESMTRKIQVLLRRLGRGTSAIHRKPPKFTIIESSKQRVDIDRKTWTEWWAHQETPRIRTVVDRYLRRGVMMPTRVGGQDVTAATLVQEVLDGVKEGRKYAEYDVAREGVEVGVFVIKRTA